MKDLNPVGGMQSGEASNKSSNIALKALLLIPLVAIGLVVSAQTEELDSLCSIPVMEIKTESLCRIIDTLKMIEREEGFADSDWVYITFMRDTGTTCVMYMMHEDNFGEEIVSWALGRAWVAYCKETKVMIAGRKPNKKIMVPSEDRYYLRCIIVDLMKDEYVEEDGDDDDDVRTLITAKYSNGEMHIMTIFRRSGEITNYE